MNRIDIQLKGKPDNLYIIVADTHLHNVIKQLESNGGVTVQKGTYSTAAGTKELEVHVKNAEVQSFIVERKIEGKTDD